MTAYGTAAAALQRAAVPIVPAVPVDLDLEPPENGPAAPAPRRSPARQSLPVGLDDPEPF